MAYQTIDGVRVWGTPDDGVLSQAKTCAEAGNVVQTLLMAPDWAVYQAVGKQEHDKLKALARDQLGTVGSGNHFVDLFEEAATGRVWIANHFGSRGLVIKQQAGS